MRSIKIVIFLSFLFLIAPLTIVVAATNQAQVLFINQVRGEECCEAGSFENLTTQVNAFVENDLPAFFAVRYDVLKNLNYVEYLRKTTAQYPQLSVGLLIEITPDLAQDAGVPYKGIDTTWHEAQNAYTIGYTDEEWERIVDHLFSTFHDTFGYDPALTSSWMIGTEALNYIHNKYGVTVHQITREQWGTDSYTLYGGPPHHPYPASQKWLFNPDYTQPNAPLIVRQTVTDPLYNYGDTTSAFTSQPNDYANDNKKFDYFTALISQTLNQPNGFALLGLENSMTEQFQEEYVKQIFHIKKLSQNGHILFPSLEELTSYWKSKKVNLYSGTDFIHSSDNAAYWISSPHYRVRLRVSNRKVFINDIRIYDTQYEDPYTNYVANKEGFWTVPYLIDGSRNYNINTKQTFFETLFGPPTLPNTFAQVTNDLKTETNRIAFPTIKDGEHIVIKKVADNAVVLTYKTSDDKTISLSFNEKNITISPLEKTQIIYENYSDMNGNPIAYTPDRKGFNLEWKIENKTAHALQTTCDNNECQLLFTSSPETFSKMRKAQYHLMFPEPIIREPNKTNTTVYLHNQYAIAARNPARIVIIPKDKNNIPLILSKPINVVSNPPVSETLTTFAANNSSIQYVDLYSNTPKKTVATIQLDKNTSEDVSIYFSPDCKAQIQECVKHPKYAWWYLNTVARDKFRKLVLKEKQS